MCDASWDWLARVHACASPATQKGICMSGQFLKWDAWQGPEHIVVRLHPSEEKVAMAVGNLGELSDPQNNGSSRSQEAQGDLAPVAHGRSGSHKEKKRQRKVGLPFQHSMLLAGWSVLAGSSHEAQLSCGMSWCSLR